MNEQLRTNAEEDIPQARDMGKPESLVVILASGVVIIIIILL